MWALVEDLTLLPSQLPRRALHATGVCPVAKWSFSIPRAFELFRLSGPQACVVPSKLVKC